MNIAEYVIRSNISLQKVKAQMKLIRENAIKKNKNAILSSLVKGYWWN
jgi:hypothetical protein